MIPALNVEPVNQEHPNYQISRNVVVKEIEKESESPSADAEQSETKETEEDDTDSEKPLEVPAETPDVSEGNAAFDALVEQMTEQDTFDEGSGLALHDVMEQAANQGVDFEAMETGEVATFSATAARDAGVGSQQVTIEKGPTYRYEDYGLGSYVTAPYYISYGSTKNVLNERTYAKIHLIKEDAETGANPQEDATLEGAVYGLYARENIVHPDGTTGIVHRAGDLVSTLKVDQKGDAVVKDLYLGKYFVKEIQAPEGYLLDETEHDVECSYEGGTVPTIERTVKSTELVMKQPFQIIKVANNGQTDADLLKGAGFSAYLKSSLEKKEDGSYDFSHAEPVILLYKASRSYRSIQKVKD